MPVIEQEITQLEKQFDLKSKDPKEVVINMGWCIVQYIIVDSWAERSKQADKSL